MNYACDVMALTRMIVILVDNTILTKKHAAFFVHSPCHFVQLRAKCWALRAKGRASQGTNQNHRAKYLALRAKYHANQSTNSNHRANLSCSCQFLLNFWHFVQNIMPTKAIVANLENSKCVRFFDFMFTYLMSITFISIMRVRFLKN